MVRGGHPVTTERVLRRADIGFGRVVIDGTTVRREGLRTRRIAWDEILEYRLTIELLWGPDAQLALPPMDDIDGFVRGLEGRSPRRYGLELLGAHTAVFFNWRFREHRDAIHDVLARIEPRLLERTHAEVEGKGELCAGPLRLGRDGVTWEDRELLPRAEVEAIELFDSTVVELRVMQRGRVRPYATVATQDIPNLGVVLAVADSLGMLVRGRELLP